MAFVELRAHSSFSFGDGSASPEQLVTAAAGMGYGALGLTDAADVGGVIRFALEAMKQGVRPIAGAELSVGGRPIALLARDARGFRNLCALVTRARLGVWGVRDEDDGAGWGVPDGLGEAANDGARSGRGGRRLSRADALGSYGARGSLRAKRQLPPPAMHQLVRTRAGAGATPPARGLPEIGWEDLYSRHEGLHVLTGPPTGELAYQLQLGRAGHAARHLAELFEVFGDRLAVEVQLHHVSGRESALAAELIELARKADVPWVATNDPRYLDGGGRLVHDLLTALRANLDVATAASWGVLNPNGEWRLKSPAEMATLWRGREEGLDESARIASECGFDLRWLRPPLPKFPHRSGSDDDALLHELAFAGARTRWGELDGRQTAQLEHELGVIRRLGFAGFFIVMWDAVRFAREHGILCQGRGSAANSAVAYCLGITAVDPVRHGLLFERFLSEVRTDGLTEAPDIDVDFEMDRREEVLDYMYRRYGRKHAAITAVTQTYHAATAVQDVMRALGYPAELAFRFSKRLHHAEPAEGADEIERELAPKFGFDTTDPRARTMLAALRALDDVPRLRSTHPGGFVLSSEPLGEWMPIERTTMGRTILQFDKDDLDAAGVPKFDFLGLGGLTAVHLAFKAIEQRTGEKLELYRLPVDDAATYEMIGRGDTVGTFQIESRAQIQSILQTKPDRLYDIVVQVALIRPGPIQARFVHPYTLRRRGLEEVVYDDERLRPILERTDGIPIFQEQAMAISMALGGYSAAEADELRRTMGNVRKLTKLKAALAKLEQRMIANGLSPDKAGSIVEDLVSFANYGFPESHAWSFALIAYATAYLKANHPAEFFMAMLNAWPMGFYSPATLAHQARRDGVRVLGPCMRDGAWDCEVLLGAAQDAALRAEDAALRAEDGAFAQDGMIATQSNAIAVHPLAAGEHPGRGAPYPAAVGGHPAAAGGGHPAAAGGGPPAALQTRGTIRVGWRHIRGLGPRAEEALQAAREAGGPFRSIEDVVKRASLTRMESLHLARAGAFEAFEPGRRKAAWEALRAAADTLPLAPAHHLPFDVRELEGEELVFLDYLATGISPNGHPMEYLRARLDAAGILGAGRLDELRDGQTCTIAGLVVARQHPSTAKGTVFLLLEDEHGFINVVVPRRTYADNRELVNSASFIVIEGRFERDGDVMNVVGFRFRELPRRGLVHRSRDFH
ncbi:MAG TPA: DNA polymerase III subunit alpha [Longimicrobiales bacterium]